MTEGIALLGGGGHAAVVIEALRATGLKPVCILDKVREALGSHILGVPVIGGDDKLAAAGATHFIVTLGAVAPGDGMNRQRLFDAGLAAGLLPMSVVHPAAIVSPSATLGAGSAVMAGAIICPRAVIGRNVIVNTRAVVEHDCCIGDHVHVATAAVLCGAVVVGDRAMVGAGATVRQCIRIAADAFIAFGSAVGTDVAPGVTVMGVPARARKH